MDLKKLHKNEFDMNKQIYLLIFFIITFTTANAMEYSEWELSGNYYSEDNPRPAEKPSYDPFAYGYEDYTLAYNYSPFGTSDAPASLDLFGAPPDPSDPGEFGPNAPPDPPDPGYFVPIGDSLGGSIPFLLIYIAYVFYKPRKIVCKD